MAVSSCAMGCDMPTACFEKDWDDISSLEVNEEVY
jgi:hypothetical protein